MKVLYICDRKQCGEKCGTHCNHTSDIMHAANFKKSEVIPGLMIEIEKEESANYCGPAWWFSLSVILWAITVAVVVVAKLL